MADISIYVTSLLTSSERRISLNYSLGYLKKRLELITGVPPANQQLLLYATSLTTDPIIIDDKGDDTLLSTFPDLIPFARLHVNDTRPDSELNELAKRQNSCNDKNEDNSNNNNNNEFFKLNEEDYSKKENTVRSWKLKNKLGRFNEGYSANKQKEIDETNLLSLNYKIDDRCKVIKDNRIGTIKYIGKIKEIDNDFIWVGIEFDEPVGKNNGSIKNYHYFNCKKNYGGFLKA
ncbi:Alf1p, partial [Ascoidea rubescens DSM 1968]